MKLQKLVYYAHAWSLALFNEPLISDRIEAWQYGPVIPALYTEFRDFGNRPIDRLAYELDANLNCINPRVPETDERTKALVRTVWDRLGHLSPIQLSNMTHADNEPWARIPKKRPGLEIPDEAIKECFRKMLTNAN